MKKSDLIKTITNYQQKIEESLIIMALSYGWNAGKNGVPLDEASKKLLIAYREGIKNG